MNKRIGKKKKKKNKNLEDKIQALQQLPDDTKQLSSKLDMGNDRKINVAHPKAPEKT